MGTSHCSGTGTFTSWQVRWLQRVGQDSAGCRSVSVFAPNDDAFAAFKPKTQESSRPDDGPALGLRLSITLSVAGRTGRPKDGASSTRRLWQVLGKSGHRWREGERIEGHERKIVTPLGSSNGQKPSILLPPTTCAVQANAKSPTKLLQEDSDKQPIEYSSRRELVRYAAEKSP
jgi:hypothetical protein